MKRTTGMRPWLRAQFGLRPFWMAALTAVAVSGATLPSLAQTQQPAPPPSPALDQSSQSAAPAEAPAGDAVSNAPTPPEAEKIPALAPPVPPTDPIASRAYSMLETHCARCHQDGKLKRPAPAGGFGNILRLDEVAADPTLVKPGNPEGSRLLTHMVRRLMPLDIHQEQLKGEEPSGDDLTAIRQWIAGLTTPPGCPDRLQITSDAVTAALVSAGGKAKWDASRQRFVSIAHLHNACGTPAELYAARQGLIQMFNSLSWKPDPVKLEVIDDARTIYRFDLADLGWVGAHWDRILQSGPAAAGRLGVISAEVQEMFKTPSPVIRADWLARYSLRAPLYYDLLALPELGSEINRILQIDPESARRSNTSQRTTVKSSDVSRSGRLIERNASAKHVLWSAYDAIAREGYRDPADTPLGAWPPSHDIAFGHFTLPNGFPAFFLHNPRGQRLDRAPVELPKRSSLIKGAMRAGGDCMTCHSSGVRLGRTESEAVPTTNTAAAGDRTTTRAAQQRAGFNTEFSLDGVAPAAMLMREYERDVSLRRLAAELMVSETALSALVEHSRVGPLIRRLVNAPVSRGEIETEFAGLLAAIGVAELPAQPQATPREPDAPSPAPVLQLLSDRVAYKSGDALTLTVSTSADCHLSLISIDQRGRGTVIFPSDFEQATLLAAGRTLKLPADGAPYAFRLRETGRETIAAICSPSGGAIDGMKHDFERQRFTDLGNYGDFLAQAYASEQQERRRGAKAAPETRPKGRKGARDKSDASEQRARPESIARTAITIEVR